MVAHLWQACSLLVFSLVGFTGRLAEASIDLDPYDEMLLQSMYKRLSEIDSNYFMSELENGLHGARDVDDGNVGEGFGAAVIRDPEYIEHSSQAANEGFLHASGQSNHTVDSTHVEGLSASKSLPFYCPPPNPCPKGYTSANGCQEGIKDTMEFQKKWITGLQQEGYCSCDHEHMSDCPASNSLHAENANSLNEIVDKILADQASATYMSGEKRQTLVAKKSPRVKRGLTNKMEKEHKQADHKKNMNPYLAGERLRTVAKKG